MKIISSKKDIFTIPNALSLFRVILAALMLWIFYSPDVENKRILLTAVLLLSAFSDSLDGKIARKFHMISEVGKILDPMRYNLSDRMLTIYNADPGHKKRDLDWVRKNAVIIHYYGKNKPWNKGYHGILNTFYEELKKK